MEFTLNNCISRINQALNYPSLAYEDVYHFFDQAIHELNSSLKIALPALTEIVDENSTHIEDRMDLVSLEPMRGAMQFAKDTLYGTYKYAPELGEFPFVVVKDEVETRVEGLYGYLVDKTTYTVKYYATVVLGGDAYWQLAENDETPDINLIEYLPFEWWTLFVIPYVCSKWAVRNGDESSHFVDEYVQGFQQLQNSYNVPNRVELSAVAGRHAYKKLVASNLANLRTSVFTRAIYEDMKVGNGIAPIYGGFYETGGWGV
jgi:hypothetical protein